jgi:hypothetical protein
MKNRFLKLLLVCMLLMLYVGTVPASAMASYIQHHGHAKPHAVSVKAVKLKEDLRKLWSDHVFWTRNFIVSDVAGLEDKEQVLARLLQNQTDIGDAIKPYYGEEAGNKLGALLKEHIVLAGKLMDAVKSGNQADAEKYNKEWYQNADDIAKLLSSVNPNWSEKELKELLYTHLQQVTTAFTSRLKKDWTGDIKNFDAGYTHILMLSDTLAEGIVKQFPKEFK